MADDLGFQPAQASEDFGFQPWPKAPDMSGVVKNAQKNLSAEDQEKQFQDIVSKPIQTPEQRLDTAAGFPVQKVIDGSAKPTDFNRQCRAEYTKALRNGSAENSSDWYQSVVHAVTPVTRFMAHDPSYAPEYLSKVGESLKEGFKGGGGLLLYPFVSDVSREELLNGYELNPDTSGTSGNINRVLELEQATVGRAMGGLFAPVAAPISPFISPLIEGTSTVPKSLGVPDKWAQIPPKAIGAAMDVLGVFGGVHTAKSLKDIRVARANGPTFPPGSGPWDNHPGADIVRQMIAQKQDVDAPAISGEHIDRTVAAGAKDIHPAAEDFKSVAAVSGIPEEALHTVYVETGVRPDQVIADAQHEPSIATDVAEGKIPPAYEHLVESQVFEPQETVKMNVVKSDNGTGFSVVDADGEHVHGGFDSAQEARHYIEDRKFEAEERAAIEAEKETPAKPTIETTPQGKQTVLPGAEKITDRQLAERKMAEPNKATVVQKAPDEGLFDTGAQKQTDLLDVTNEKKSPRTKDILMPDGTPSGSKILLDENGRQVGMSSSHTIETKQVTAEPNMVTHEVTIKEPVRPEPTLPKELSGAKPRYGYGSKQFTLKFESDIDRAAYTVSGKGESKAHAKYEKFLKDNGFDDTAIAELGKKVRDAVKAIAKDSEAGELNIKSSRGESPVVEKSPKPLTKDTVPPSAIGKPTSLSTFIKNNGGIKPSAVEGGDLLSAGHGDLLRKNGKNIDDMRAMAEEQGYIPEGLSVPEFQEILQNTDGGREHFREADADRVAASAERKLEAERNDPVRLEHEAEKVGIDTKKLPNETEKQWSKRIKNALHDFYRNSEGFGRVRSEAGKWLLNRPIETVEKWAGKLTGNIFQRIGEGYIKTFQPELMGDKALRTDSFMAKYKVALQEAENAYYRQWADEIKAWDKTTHDERMQWLYDHETGRWSPETAPDHAIEQAIYDAMYKAEQEAGVSSEAYKENYLPHQWENPDAVAAHFKSDALIKKYGKDWFTKASVFQLIQEGVRAGFKLKTDNPARMRIARQLASYNMIATMDLLKDLEGSGIAVPTKAFSVEKRIAKTERQIAELQDRYKKEFEKANDPKQTTTEGTPPAESKMMKLVQKRMDDLKARLEEFNAEKAANKLTPEQMKDLKNGFKVIGPDNKAWSISQEAGPLWKNAIDSKGLWENQGLTGSVYRNFMAAKATWVATKLMASLFHPMHVAVIDLAADIATPIHHLIQGGKISDLITKESLPNMGLTKNTIRGKDHPAIVASNTPKELRTPQQQYLVTKMIEGGMKPTMSARDTVHFRENFDKAINGVGLNNLRLIGTALQLPGTAMKPFMEHWIPGMKAEIYDRATELALARDPSLKTDAGKRGEVFRQITKDIERTYGEMNQDTLFWNKTMRDAFNASYISGGWKLAQLYNLNGLLTPAKIAGKFLKTGEFSKADVTYQMINAYTYTALTLATGAMIAKILGQPIAQAGEDGWDIVKNLVSPKTGDKNADGTDIRISQPAFAKEGYMVAKDINEEGLIGGIGSFVYHGTLVPGIMHVLTNRDFAGREIISDPTNLHQWMNAGWDSISPITIQGIEKANTKDSEVAKVAGLFGFPMAGAYMNQSPFEQKIIHTYFEQNPSKDDAYTAKLKGDMRAASARGDSDAMNKIEKRMIKEGISSEDIGKSKRVYTDKFSDYAWSKLPVKDQKRLIESASEEEKQKFTVKSQ